ncbi:hypothetical protein ACIGMX_04380 [Streptomyces aquilus]|uniref:hypothetical protein n=1 Tax=Streptomyces aquilus TaxID=2548456 RepID=UPI0037CEF8EA
MGASAAVRLLGRPIAEVRPVWAEIRARDPGHRDAHLHALGCLYALGCLSPEEQRSHSALRDFLDERPARSCRRTPRRHACRRRPASHWPVAGRIRHAAAVADLGLLAYAFVRAGRAAEAHPVFSAIDGQVTPWP